MLADPLVGMPTSHYPYMATQSINEPNSKKGGKSKKKMDRDKKDTQRSDTEPEPESTRTYTSIGSSSRPSSASSRDSYSSSQTNSYGTPSADTTPRRSIMTPTPRSSHTDSSRGDQRKGTSPAVLHCPSPTASYDDRKSRQTSGYHRCGDMPLHNIIYHSAAEGRSQLVQLNERLASFLSNQRTGTTLEIREFKSLITNITKDANRVRESFELQISFLQ